MTNEGTSELLFLVADSRPLFDDRFAARITKALPSPAVSAKAAYLGAANGDAPEPFDLFCAVMDRIGVRERMHVHAAPTEREKEFLAAADLLLLAGGDVAAGWRAFEKAGIVDVLRARHAAGALLVGVSAGAVHIGTAAAFDPDVKLLSLVPYAVCVHDEPDWASGLAVVERGAGAHVGLGIPFGGAVVVHADRSVDPVGKPVTEITWTPAGTKVSEIVAAQISPRRTSADGSSK